MGTSTAVSKPWLNLLQPDRCPHITDNISILLTPHFEINGEAFHASCVRSTSVVAFTVSSYHLTDLTSTPPPLVNSKSTVDRDGKLEAARSTKGVGKGG
jgi:hypothetical protein